MPKKCSSIQSNLHGSLIFSKEMKKEIKYDMDSDKEKSTHTLTLFSKLMNSKMLNIPSQIV